MVLPIPGIGLQSFIIYSITHLRIKKNKGVETCENVEKVVYPHFLRKGHVRVNVI